MVRGKIQPFDPNVAPVLAATLAATSFVVIGVAASRSRALMQAGGEAILSLMAIA